MSSAEDEVEIKRAERIAAFARALPKFQTDFKASAKGRDLSIAPNAAKDLANVYFTLHERDIRPHVDEYSICFKMASLTEKTVYLIQPFRNGAGEPDREANAIFGFCCSLAIMEEMKEGGTIDQDGVWACFRPNMAHQESKISTILSSTVSHKHFYASFERVIKEHKVWLQTFDGKQREEAFPMLHNATFLDILWHGMHFPFTITP